MPDYPEHEKLSAVKEKSQEIGEFLDFSPYTLCELRHFDENGVEFDRWVPVGKPIQEILAEWFKIDLNKLEEEKRQMLDALRTLNDAKARK